MISWSNQLVNSNKVSLQLFKQLICWTKMSNSNYSFYSHKNQILVTSKLNGFTTYQYFVHKSVFGAEVYVGKHWFGIK